MEKLFRIYIILTLSACSGSSTAEDTVFPGGVNVESGYSLSATIFSTSDTLVIRRTVVNNENYDLSSLFFSENLPPGFAIIDHMVSVNGGSIQYEYSGTSSGSTVAGYDNHCFVIDSPEPGNPVQNVIYPGDSLIFDLRVTCGTAGDYSLPLHTTVVYGNDNGLFATDDPVTITVAADTTPPSAISDLVTQ